MPLSFKYEKKGDRFSFNEMIEKMQRIPWPKFIKTTGISFPSLPLWLRMPIKSFNFILFHYIYLIAMSIICSIIVYPSRNMPYVDALFFAAGSATQSGLNT
jgi:hypothetical protein